MSRKERRTNSRMLVHSANAGKKTVAGLLYKRGTFGRWKMKQAELKKCVMEFTNRGSTALPKQLNLKDWSVREVSGTSFKPFSFVLISPFGTSFCFAALSEEQKQEWIIAIKENTEVEASPNMRSPQRPLSMQLIESVSAPTEYYEDDWMQEGRKALVRRIRQEVKRAVEEELILGMQAELNNIKNDLRRVKLEKRFLEFSLDIHKTAQEELSDILPTFGDVQDKVKSRYCGRKIEEFFYWLIGDTGRLDQLRLFAKIVRCEEIIFYCSEIHFFENGLPVPFEITCPQEAELNSFDFGTPIMPNQPVTCWAERIHRDYISENGVWAVNLDADVRIAVLNNLTGVRNFYKEELQRFRIQEQTLEFDKVAEQQLLHQRYRKRQLQLFEMVTHQCLDMLWKDVLPKFLVTLEGKLLFRQFEAKLPNYITETAPTTPQQRPHSPSPKIRREDLSTGRNFLRSAHRMNASE